MIDEKYTPIKDRKTNEPILLGDLVENEKGQCGTLIWDEYYNRYLIGRKLVAIFTLSFILKLKHCIKIKLIPRK